MRVCQTARAAAAHARALPRDARVTWHLSRHGRRAIAFWQVAATPLFAANAKRTASLGASSRASRCPNKRRRRWPCTPRSAPRGILVCAAPSKIQRRADEGTPTSKVSHTRSVARGRDECPKRRTRPPRADVRSGDVWRNLPISPHRRLEAAETQPPTRPMRVPDMNQNKKSWSCAACPLQRSLHSTLGCFPTTAGSAQFCLLCCQPEPFPESLPARPPSLTRRCPCSLPVWSGQPIHMVHRTYSSPRHSVSQTPLRGTERCDPPQMQILDC